MLTGGFFEERLPVGTGDFSSNSYEFFATTA
jgi:hypothetical protein